MESPCILLVAGDDDIVQDLETNLTLEGYRVHTETDGPSGLERALDESWTLVIVDLALQGMGGLELLRKLRCRNRDVPVLVITQPEMNTERVLALRMGADDCLNRPVVDLEFLARVDALLRRWRWSPSAAFSGTGLGEGNGAVGSMDGAGAGQGNGSSQPTRGPASGRPVFRFDQIQVDPGARQVFRDGDPVALTPREFDLLLALIESQGDVISRRDLLEQVWKGSVPPTSRTVDTHMAELRKKLEEDAAQPRHLLTVRKRGYRFQP